MSTPIQAIPVLYFLTGYQVSRLTNPLGSHLSFILIFGSQLLALSEDGTRMYVWDTKNEGLSPAVAMKMNQ